MVNQWITTLAFAAAALLNLVPQTSSTADGPSSVRGSVVDMEGGRVVGASLHFVEQRIEYDTKTLEDGTYLLHLKPGMYTVRVSRFGFCDGRRGSFTLTQNMVLNFDFELIPCDIVDPVTTGEGGSNRGGSSNYDPYREDRRGGYKYEELESPPSAKVNPLIAFGGRDSDSGVIAYIGQVVHGKYVRVKLTYDRYTLRANSIRYSRDGRSFTAEGDVVWQDGAHSTTASRLEVLLDHSVPVVRRMD